MTEIYRDSTDKTLELGITGAVVSKVEFIRRGEILVTAVQNPVTVPYAVTHEDGDFDVKWYYTVDATEYTRINTYSVVTPLFLKQDLLDEDTMYSTLTDNQVIELEQMIRKIIEAYTGQRFGYREGSVSISGSGYNYLSLPERALTVNDTNYSITNNGYAIKVVNPAQAISENGVIGYQGTTAFSPNLTYKVYGTFGWTSVPDDVRRAALILAELFSCDETTWRDRYIKSIRAADWRFDYDGGTYRGTGSVSADQLLAKYVIGGIYVV